MDFDFNVILVPVTLFLGVIWLLDIVWLKQHKRERLGHSKEQQAAEDNLASKTQAYKNILTEHNIEFDPQNLDAASTDDAPMPVRQAEREYRQAKRNVSITSNLSEPKASQAHFLIRWAHDYFIVLAVVLVVRSFIIEPFNIPSSSMVPTLYTGDYVAVNKYAYGIRLPLTYNKVIDTGNPEHGDVVVFRYPENPKIYYIKRVIGLPGDSVSFNQGQLSVNGQPVPSKQVNFVADEVLTDRLYTPWTEPGLTPEKAVLRARNEEVGVRYYQEQLGDHTYLRRYLAPSLQVDAYSSFLNQPISYNGDWNVVVPEGNYFVMGDNSDRSEDSRFWGFVPDENLAGKAVYVWMHKKPGLTNLPTFKYNRSID
ncbi:signal peptidase I [Psychrobacter lutiphocae]|uniref:signal peptidase I n=1 Tax=Psychrobacter lutiphocae TaxID=540500 RepID=UPI000378C5BA|nr:signal peptidase I [Psychrobacter lutiphocae]